MRVLITGSSGFVGRHFAERLQVDGHDVYGVDVRCGPLFPSTHAGIDCREFFARNPDGAGRYDLIVHCAAVVGGRAKIDGDPLAVAQNLGIDAELFRWVTHTPAPPRVVYFSSSAAYPIWRQRVGFGQILAEDNIDLGDPQSPDQTYGWAKLTGERLAAQAEAEGVRVYVFRPFSGYGADQDLDYPFPALTARALRREDPFQVWGTGRQTRDWIHVDDIVDAVLAAITLDIPGPVNLCTGRPTDFLTLAEMVCAAAGYTPTIRPLPDQPTGVHYRVGDPTKLHTFYRPRVSLEEGIRRAVEHAALTA